MRNTKRIVALLLCLTLLVSAMAIFVSAAETEPETQAPQSTSVEPTYTTEWPTTEGDAESAAQQNILSPVSGNDALDFNVNTFNGVEGDYEYAVHTFGDNKFMSMDRIPSSNSNAYFDIFAGGTRTAHTMDANYTIVQFDAAYFGVLDGTINPLFRSTAGPAAFSISNITLFDGVAPGEVAQFTFVFYYADGKGYNDVYRDGVKLGAYGTEIADPTITYADSLRVYFNQCYMVFDNVYACHSATNPAADGVLANEYSQFDDAEYTKLVLPSIVSVNGVEYNNVTTASAALVDGAEVEFLAQPWESDDKLVVNCSATINTNGFVTADDLDLANATYSVDGNIIKTAAPNWYKQDMTSAEEFDSLVPNATLSPVTGGTSATIWVNIFAEGQNAIYTFGGNAAATLSGASGYVHFGTSNASSTKLNVAPYMIVQFDSCYLGAAPSGTLRPVSQQPATNAFTVQNSTLYAGLESGEVAQFTFVFYAIPGTDGISGVGGCDVYRNGEQISTSGNRFTYADLSTGYHNGIRAYLNADTTLLIDNIYSAHYAADPVALGADGKYTFGNSDQFASAEYAQLKLPTIAKVDGVEYNTVTKLNAALAIGGKTVEVEFLHDYTIAPWGKGSKIAVNCNAVINTNGFITAEDLDLSNVSASVNGNVISTFAPNFTVSTSGFGSAVKSDFANNEFSTSTSVNSAAAGNWEIITTADGNQFANFHQTANRELEAAGSNGKLIRWDLVTSAADKHITVTPSFTVQFELIRTGQVDGNAVGVLGKYNGSYLLNDSAFNLNVMNDYPIGEAVQFTVNFGATKNEDGTGLITVNTYINGVWHKTVTQALGVIETTDETTGETVTTSQYDGFTWTCLRLPIAENMALNEVALDNMYIRGFETNVLDENGRLPDEYSQFARADHKKLALPDVALVDGDAVSYDEIDAKLNDGGNHTVELLHKPWRTLTVQSTSTIKTNGYTGYVVAGNGYILEESDGVITVAPDDRRTNIKITLDGQTITTIEDALYSNSHEEIIRNYSLDNALHQNSVYYKDGKYYELVWDFSAKPEYAEEITYEATLKPAVILVVNTDTNRVVHGTLSYDDNGVLTDGLKQSFSAVYYFNSDVNSSALFPVDNVANNVTWELNGHTYNYTAPAGAGVHGFVFDTTDRFEVNNGKIKVSGGDSFIMSAHGSNPTVTFNNVTYTTAATALDWRAGTFNFNNCTLNNTHISIGARVENNISINFDGCTFNCSNNTLFNFFNNDLFADHTAGELTNFARHITIKNSTIKAKGALVAMHHEDAINVPEGEINDRLLYIENSTVYAGYVYDGTVLDGVVKLGEGVRYSIATTAHLEKLTADEGVQLFVKTNDIAFDYLATANYATVNWAEGVTEYWAEGTVPTAPSAEYKNLAVGPVVAGSEYNFENTVGAATDFELTANLTLHSNVYYNFYVERAASVTINGQLIEGVNGRYSYELLPKYALGELHIVVVFDDGSVYSRTTNLMEYINKSAADTEYAYNAQLVQVYANMLQYFLDVQDYERMVLAQSAAKEFISTYNPAAAEEINAIISGNINDYFKSATFLLDGDVKLVITGKDGVTLDGVTVTVGDYTATAIAVDGQLYVVLPAYLLTEAVDITVGDVTVQYSLGAYVNNAEESAVAVATSLYNYANAANLYEEVLNTTDAQ